MGIRHVIKVLCIVVILGSLVLFWWNGTFSIVPINPLKISKIEIFNGNTGMDLTITDTNEINHIVTNLNSIRIKKDKISLGYMGYYLRTTLYTSSGRKYKSFTINGNDAIRKDPFFYNVTARNKIDIKYIEKLFKKKTGNG